MYVTSKAGTEILKSQYEIIDSINGIPTLETDYSQLKHNHTEPMLMLSPAFTDKYIMVLKEQESVTESSRLRLTGVHSFIYDFSLDRIYEEYTQYFSLENILTLVFSDTEYEYEVSGSTRYNALEFENFGNNDKMSLINQICDRWELEYRVKGNKVYFADQRGTKTTKQFRYKMNIHDSHVNLDISEGATYIRAYFGKKDEENPSNSTYVEKEMLHPLAEDFGVRHAKPYSNEVITQEETMQRYMKMKIEETWKLSVEIDVLDLSGDGSAEVGDEVWAIDERMDLKYKTRIVEKRDYYDVNDRIYRTKVVLGNKTFIEAVSAQEVTAEDLEYEVRRYTNKRIEQLKAEKDNDFNAIRDTLRSEFSDALAQSKIEVAADFDRMEKLLDTKSDEWTEDFNQSVAESKNYAEQQAQSKAEEVRTDLEEVTSGHQALIDDLKGDVMDIDTFLGDKSKTLKQQFDKVRTDFGTLQTDLEGVESDLTATKTDLQKQLDEARAKLDGLEVGGKNLLRGTSDSWTYDSMTTQWYRQYFYKDTFLEVGQTYTFSYIVEKTSDDEYPINVSLGLGTISYQYDIPGTHYYNVPLGAKNSITFVFTQAMADRGYENRFAFRFRNERNPMSIRYKEIQLEKGTIATDWTPAPEDTEQKITTLNQQIEFIDGQLSAKLEQTDLLPINNKITEYGNSLTANAQSIESLISKTELHDGDIAKWSNQTTANAESITSALSRISSTESGLTKAQTDITANANGLSAVVNRVNKTETGIDSLSTRLTAEAGKVETLISKTDGHTTQLANIVADYNSIEQTVAANDEWLGTHGSNVLQTVEGFNQKVWQADIHNPNMIPFNNLTSAKNRAQWLTRGPDTLSYLDDENMIRIINYTSPHNYVQSPYVSLQAGETYTLSFTSLIGSSYNLNDLMQYTYVVYPDRDNVLLRDLMRRELIGSAYDVNIYKFTVTFTAEETTDKARILIGAYVLNQGQRSDLFIGEPKLEMGETATLYNNALSIFEQRADELKLAVTDSDGLASVIALSPTAIDLISDKINVTGNVNIKGGVTALAVDAIEGNFARLFASELTAGVIKAEYLEGGNLLVEKVFGTSGRIDHLITKTHFVNEMHALTLNVIDLNASNIRARLLSANTIEAEWLKGGTALLDKVFASTAMFERMMAKSGFVSTLNTVTIDTDQITIRRYDGAALISRGTQRFGSPIITKPFPSNKVTFDGVNYVTDNPGSTSFERAYAEHSGRLANFTFSLGLTFDSRSSSVMVRVTANRQNYPEGGWFPHVSEEFMAFRDGSRSYALRVPLPAPTFGAVSWILEFNVVDSHGNYAQIRSNRCWISS